MHKEVFQAGLRLPLHPFVRELLVEMTLSLGQIKPNGWGFVVSCCILWQMVVGRTVTLREFLYLYLLFKKNGSWAFQGRSKKFIVMPKKWNNRNLHETKFFFIFGDWEFPVGTPNPEGCARVPKAWRLPNKN
jgi:hypothetical protein